MKSSILLLTLIIAILSACNNTENKEKDLKTLEILSQLAPNADFSQKIIVLIIPFDGCVSCFTEATKLIQEVLNDSGIVIMPNIHKRRVNNFSENIGIDRDDIIIDTLRLTIINKLIDINPKIFIVNKHKIVYSNIVELQSINEIRTTVFR